MAHREPNKFYLTRPPSLRVDSLRAHRQNQDAVILPIVYDLSAADHAQNFDSLIIPISLPIRTTVVTSLQSALSDLERKQNLALLKKKLDVPRKRPAKLKPSSTPQSVLSSTNASGTSEPSNHLQTWVTALLASVILLVFFAWMCFR